MDQGTELRLHCRLSVTSDLAVSWMLRSRPLTSSRDRRVRLEQHGRVLVVAYARETDEGRSVDDGLSVQ